MARAWLANTPPHTLRTTFARQLRTLHTHTTRLTSRECHLHTACRCSTHRRRILWAECWDTGLKCTLRRTQLTFLTLLLTSSRTTIRVGLSSSLLLSRTRTVQLVRPIPHCQPYRQLGHRYPTLHDVLRSCSSSKELLKTLANEQPRPSNGGKSVGSDVRWLHLSQSNSRQPIPRRLLQRT